MMFAVIFIPNFSLQAALRHEPDLRERPVALVDPKLARPVIVQLTAAAQAFGVAEGLTPSQATARCAELILKIRSPAQEESATEVLLQTACAFSPNFESTAPGVCTLELKGLPLGSNADAMEPWAKTIRDILAQFYIDARIGLAATPELALLAARAADPVLTLNIAPENSGEKVQTLSIAPNAGTTSPSPIGWERAGVRALVHEGRILESFPITALEPPPETLEILQRWGIHTIGALLALDKNDVTERLGPAVAELLKRVSPGSPRPLKLVTPSETFSEQIEFENEIETTQPLLFVLRRFVEQLSRRLELIYLVISEFQLQLGLSSGAKYERTFKIPAPTANIETLFRMLQTHLETVRTDSPITSLRLAAKPARAEAQQFGLFESSLRDPNQFAETLAQLTALVGSDNIGTPEPVASHKPDSFRMTVPEFNGEHARPRRSVSNVRRKNSPKSSRIEPTNRKRGASLPPLRHAVGERDGVRWRQGTGGEALPHEIHGKAHQNHESDRCSAGVPPASSRTVSVQDSGGETPPELAAGTAALHLKIGLVLRRFRPPMPSQVEFRDEKPSLLRCRIFIGPVVETRGPFLSSGNWWDTGRWERQEWDIKTSDGSLLRIFRSADGCFVEGMYD